MSKVAGVDLFPVDIGMAVDVPSVTVKEEKVAYGTRNFSKEPAMTREEVWQAIEIGIRKVEQLKEQGYEMIATGEMGSVHDDQQCCCVGAVIRCTRTGNRARGRP